ncbi:MAG: shikimate kinase [Candidatus Methylacidiphilaceae bacterium]
MAREFSQDIGLSDQRTAASREKRACSAAAARGHLVLVGMMGCGKSVLGRLLGRRSGLPVYDLDRIVSRWEHCSISALFEKKGEAYFRRKEAEVLRWALGEPTGILPTGGGTFVFEENRRLLLEQGVVFYLEAPVDLLEARLCKSRGRPLLTSAFDRRQALQQLLEKREPFYRMAHLTIPVAERSGEELGALIWRLYCERAAKVR